MNKKLTVEDSIFYSHTFSSRICYNLSMQKQKQQIQHQTTSQNQKQRIFSQKQQQLSEQDQSHQFPLHQSSGTQYTNWLLTRSVSHNHSIQHLKRKHLKDRYSIHKLTNIKFLCALANHKTQYSLTTNQKIILLSQLNHVFNILKKQKIYYNEFNLLKNEIIQELKDPHDLICIGTFISTLANLGVYDYLTWQSLIDSLMVRKSDQQYDQIFGIIYSLNQYKLFSSELYQYNQLKQNIILQYIPVLYRNHLQLLRQFIKFNIYNLKQTRLLLQCLYKNKINQKYFWKSISLWFNIYMKEQVQKKNIQEYFIMSEKCIEKVINDDGMIRPRPILEELTDVAYMISKNITDSKDGIINEKDKLPLKRYLQFVQDLILYAIENGSSLYVKYLNHHQHIEQSYQSQINYNQQQQQQQSHFNSSHSSFSSHSSHSSFSQQQQQLSLNRQFQTKSQKQRKQIKKMQKKYKTIFINPIQIKNQNIVQLIVIMKKVCGYDENGQIPVKKQQKIKQNKQNKQKQNKQKQSKQQCIFTRPQQLIDINVLKWLITRLCKDQMNYTIPQLLQIIKSSDFLSYSRINLDQLIVSKLKHLRSSSVSLKQLRSLMLFLPIQQFQLLQQILHNFLLKSHPSQILHLTNIIQSQSVSLNDQQYPSDYPRKQQPDKWLPHLIPYFMKLPEIVNLHYKYYSFQQNCYFLYYLLKSQVYWENYVYDGKSNYLGEMEKLKQSVKIASYSRGFKLQMNSYFYKLLNYVDLVEFFEGGNV